MRTRTAFLLVAAAVVLSSCGTTGGSGAPSTGPVTPPPTSPTVAPDDPALTTAPERSRRVTATGTVRAVDVEGGCFTMTIEGQSYQLVGAVPGLRDGLEVTVTGYADPTMATTCQVGPAFVVLSSTTA